MSKPWAKLWWASDRDEMIALVEETIQVIDSVVDPNTLSGMRCDVSHAIDTLYVSGAVSAKLALGWIDTIMPDRRNRHQAIVAEATNEGTPYWWEVENGWFSRPMDGVQRPHRAFNSKCPASLQYIWFIGGVRVAIYNTRTKGTVLHVSDLGDSSLDTTNLSNRLFVYDLLRTFSEEHDD